MFTHPITPNSEKKHGKHPSQKPLKIIDTLVLALTNNNDIIIDPFIGSGTTGVSSRRNGRRFIGIDNNYEYKKLADIRIKNSIDQ
jgi:DNA modification methylase